LANGLFTVRAIISSRHRSYLFRVESAQTTAARGDWKRITTMSTTLRLPTLARAATLSLALALPALAGFAGAAHADDEYGTGHEALVQQAARSAPSFGTAIGLAIGQPQAQAVARNAGQYVQVRTDASSPTVQQDLLGTGGQQDNLARETFHPGSGTDW